ncbi:hypothetical protein JW766_04045 [Candidatus Dojkabacteria bacterium]|nr:hypothetical protein [Candidatus Dojkabacteria bacterium]
MSKGRRAVLSLVTVVFVGVVGFFGGFTVKQVLASSGEYSTIVENLAGKFGLKPDDVHAVFEETRDQHFEERLDEAVEDGDITEDQKNLILEKRGEIESKAEAIDEEKLTASERRAKMEDLREEIEDWAEKNNIPKMFLRMGGKEMGRGKGMGRGMGFMEEE